MYPWILYGERNGEYRDIHTDTGIVTSTPSVRDKLFIHYRKDFNNKYCISNYKYMVLNDMSMLNVDRCLTFIHRLNAGKLEITLKPLLFL